MEFVPSPDARGDDAPWPAMAWPPRPGLELHGHSVVLRAADPDLDAAELHAALDEDAVWAHVAGRPESPVALAAALWAHIQAASVPWVVRLARPLAGWPAGAVVGTSSFLDPEPADARLEIGRTLYARAFWATTVNPEAKLLLLSLAFDELGAGRVQFQTDVRNVRSQRAIARLGATREGVLRRHKRRDDGTVRDSVVFSVLAEEWPAVRAGLRARLAASEPGLRAPSGRAPA